MFADLGSSAINSSFFVPKIIKTSFKPVLKYLDKNGKITPQVAEIVIKKSKNLRYKVHIKEKSTEKALKITQNPPDFFHRKP